MDPDKANTSVDIQVIDKMMDRWRLRLLTHGAASDSVGGHASADQAGSQKGISQRQRLSKALNNGDELLT